MLIPVVWFEESALIPEESAKKFRTLFTERVRLINFTLISLLLASLVLLIIDIRLIIATQYWRRFKVRSIMAQFAAPDSFRSSSSARGITHASGGGDSSNSGSYRGGDSPTACGAGLKSARSYLVVDNVPTRSQTALSTGTCEFDCTDGSSFDLLSGGSAAAVGSSPLAPIKHVSKQTPISTLCEGGGGVGGGNSAIDTLEQLRSNTRLGGADKWSEEPLDGVAPVERSEAANATITSVRQVDNRSIVSISNSHDSDLANNNNSNNKNDPLTISRPNNDNNNAKQVR